MLGIFFYQTEINAIKTKDYLQAWLIFGSILVHTRSMIYNNFLRWRSLPVQTTVSLSPFQRTSEITYADFLSQSYSIFLPKIRPTSLGFLNKPQQRQKECYVYWIQDEKGFAITSLRVRTPAPVEIKVEHNLHWESRQIRFGSEVDELGTKLPPF